MEFVESNFYLYLFDQLLLIEAVHVQLSGNFPEQCYMLCSSLKEDISHELLITGIVSVSALRVD